MEMTVVGGMYREICVEPRINTLRGSGLRAAALLRSLGHDVSLFTCVDEASTEEAAAVLHDFGVVFHTCSRADDVTFAYDTPVSTARWKHCGELEAIEIDASRVVAFGMVDATWRITADQVVLDPQHGDLDLMLQRVMASSVAVVLNAHEAAGITGLPAMEAGPAILGRGVQVVVVKQGARGGLVFTADAVEAFGPIPTAVTHTIGSGDAFTAGFAHAWLANGADALAAARSGSRVAAAHSMTGLPQVSPEQLAALPTALIHPGDRLPRVYLAAPFFSTSERLLVEMANAALLDAGVEVFSPLHEVGIGGDEVAVGDLEGLNGCHAVLALLDGADPGTVFEAGWATRAGIPIVGLVECKDLLDWTMLRGTGATLVSDLTSAIHLAAWEAMRRVTGASG